MSENHRFVVPIYQRTYTWTEKRQLEPLFAQIEAKAEERLKKGKADFPHYMGSLLVIPEGEATFGRVQAFDIVDGQQRLTTFHLCFASLRDVAKSKGFDDLVAKLEALLLHSELVESDKQHGRYKLQPNAFDRECFRDMIDLTRAQIQAKYQQYFYKNGKIISKGGTPTPLAAYWFFAIRAEAFIAVDEGDARTRLLALADAIFQHFQFIVITLSKEDGPQVIFVTLNTGGEPLAAMDLVRNDVFLRASRNHEDEESLMDTYWRIFEDSFWKQEHVFGRIRKPLMDFFLAHTLATESGEMVSLTELYAEYKKFTKRIDGRSISDELQRITQYAPIYRELIQPQKNSPLHQLSHRLEKFDVSTAYPLILLIAASDVAVDVKEALYGFIGSYIIRRALCGLTAKNYNVVFLDVVSYLRIHGVSVESFSSAMELKKNSEAARFPDDRELREAVINRDQYNRLLPRHRLAFVIEELELASRDKFAASEGIRPGLTVEHIMPQQWQEHWRELPSKRMAPLPGGLATDEEMAKEMAERNRIIHTIANLSFLTPPANSSAGNSSFDDKKPRLLDALLRMNLDIAQHKTWSEAQIMMRANVLADLSVTIWPAPVICVT